MISLFSSSSANNPIDVEEESKRARLQAVIDRAIEIPEMAISDEMQGFFAREEASGKAEAAVNPWDVVKEFMREEVRENAA